MKISLELRSAKLATLFHFAASLLAVFFLANILHSQSNFATPFTFTTLAGRPQKGSDDGLAAQFYNPSGIAVDSTGNLYVADSANHTIRKISPVGVVTTLAGSAGHSGSVDGSGAAARFSSPNCLAIDSADTLYVADSGNNTIRKITPTGVVTTLAGSAGSSGWADGNGSAAQFDCPLGIAVDGVGNLYVADKYNCTIRKITAAGVVTTFAGLPPWVEDSTGTVVRFSWPFGVAVDSTGTVFVADAGGKTIRKITPSGMVTAFAGGGSNGDSADGIGTAAGFAEPKGIVADNAGNLYVTDAKNSTIRKITAAGAVTTLAGSPGSKGLVDSTGASARFNGPFGIAVDSAGNLYVADSANDAIRKVTPSGVVTTVSGETGSTGSSDGTGPAARFNSPNGVAVDTAGNIYIADSGNYTIRKMAPSGLVTTLAGSAGISGSADGTGTSAQFTAPSGLVVDIAGNIFVADNKAIRKITPAGVVTTIAGSAASVGSSVDGVGGDAQFMRISCIGIDSAGNLYVVDEPFACEIRKVTPNGVVTTIAGTTNKFYNPRGIAVDHSGNIYVADTLDHMVRKVSQAGDVTVVAGSNSFGGGNADGTSTAALFTAPYGLAVDTAGNIYVTDPLNINIRKIAPDGVVTTLAGGFNSGSADGTGISVQFLGPTGIAVDSAGVIYVADAPNNTIRRGSSIFPAITSARTSSATVGTPYSYQVTGTNSPTSFAAIGLPAGLSLEATTGLISGTPTKAGAATVSLTATNAAGTSAALTMTITISNAASSSSSSSGTGPASSSGGGGGAPSEWFLIALILLGGVQTASNRRARSHKRGQV